MRLGERSITGVFDPMSDLTVLDQILLDPATAYRSPEQVLADSRFSFGQKIEILRRWEYDAVELSVATEEGMPGQGADLLPDIIAALKELGAEIDTEHTATTKQGGLDKSSIRRKS